MKHIILCFLSFSTSFISYSQNSGYTYEPFGHRSDYEKGYCYSHTGEKFSGLIKWECSGYPGKSGVNFIFMKSAPDEKKIKLTTNEIKAFVIGKDSFDIVKLFYSLDANGYNKDFARVVEAGNLTLYSHCREIKSYASYGAASTGIECFYYIKKDDTLSILKRIDFKHEADFLFGDDKELMNKITKKELGFQNLEQIVAEYNAWHEKKYIVTDPVE